MLNIFAGSGGDLEVNNCGSDNLLVRFTVADYYVLYAVDGYTAQGSGAAKGFCAALDTKQSSDAPGYSISVDL